MTLTTDEYAFALLGDFEVTSGGNPVSIRGRRLPALLAMLLLEANQAVPTPRIIQGLWGAEPPKAARESVQYFVHQLRKTLPDPRRGPRGILETHDAGYLLRVQPAQIDVVRFQQLARQADAARAQGELRNAWSWYGQALGLWRGDALSTLAREPFARPAIDRLEQERLTAVEGRLGVGLDLGRHADLVGELEALVRAHPDREGLRYLLMLALYRAGRQAEALEAYRPASAGLAELQRAILTHDPRLTPRPQAASALPDVVSQVVSQVAEPRPVDPAPAAAGAPPATQVAPLQAGRQPAEPERQQRDERKLITALVVGTAGGGPQAAAPGDPEDLHARTAQIMNSMTPRIRQYGGVVQAVAMNRLLAVFGAVRSLEDDPERAVRAALEITGTAPDGWGLRAGVATGEAVVTAQDGDPPVVATGDVLNTAVGLETGAAAGTVVVGEGTFRATSRAIVYRLPEASTAGALAGVGGWLAVTPRARTGAALADLAGGPLVERDREVRILTGVLDRFLRDREPQLLTMVSAPGLGKTRLVAELGRMVDQAPELVTWRTGRSLPSGVGSLWALSEIVRAHAGIQDTDRADQAADKLGQAVAQVIADPDEAAWVADRLGLLLGSAAGTGQHAPVPDPALLDCWVRFFGAVAARRPMVVVVEDLHWADGALLEFLDELVERVGPVPLLVVCTARLELLEQRPQWGGGKRNTATVSLSPLSADGAARLLDVLLDDARIDTAQLTAPVREALLAASGGNPLYLQEYVRILREGHADPAAVPGPDHTHPVPQTIQQLIAARLDTLEPADKRLLQDAAVIGEVGWAGALVAVSGHPPDQVEARLARLERQELLRRVRGSSMPGETEYTFRHNLIREVAYSQVLRGDQIAKHQQAAAWIQRLTADQHKRTELLAYHYTRAHTLARAAGQPTEALADQARHTLRAAADHAAALGAFAAAAGYYNDALGLWPADDPERPQLLTRLGETRMYLELRGKQPLVEARDAFLAAGDTTQAADVERRLGVRARIVGEIAQASQHLRRAAEMAGESLPVRASALAYLALERSIVEEHDEALRVGGEVLELAREPDIPAPRGIALSAIGQSRIYLGDLDGGVAHYRQGLELLEQVNDPWAGFSRWGLVLAYWQYGDLAGVRATIDECRSRTDPSHAVASWLGALEVCLDFQRGRWDTVTAFVERLLTRPASTPTRLPEPWPRPLRGRVRLARGDIAGAREDAGAALELAQVLGEPRMRHTALALLGRIELAAGRRDRAAARLQELLTDQQTSAQAPTVTLDQAELLIGLDRPGEVLPAAAPPTAWNLAARALAMRRFPEAAERYHRIGAPVAEAAARLHAARAHATGGHPELALRELDQALPVWERAGARVELEAARALREHLPVAP